jgi:hypothetical protein
MVKDHETDLSDLLRGNPPRLTLEGKASDSPDPKGVGPSLADLGTALSTSPSPKETGHAPSDPANGIFASPDGIYANKPSGEGRARARGPILILTTQDATHMPHNDPEQCWAMLRHP